MAEARQLPIFMHDRSVQGILEGRKRQTRRVVTDHTSRGNFPASCLRLDGAWVDPGPSPAGNPGPYLKGRLTVEGLASRYGGSPTDWDPDVVERLYPRWEVGDLLYVRETFTPYRFPGLGRVLVEYAADGTKAELAPTRAYRFPDDAEEFAEGEDRNPPRWIRCKRRPSIFMPKWASRIWLEVTGVRVERVRSIGRDDSFAEGVETVDPYEETPDLPPGMPACFRNYLTGGWFAGDPVASFRTAWDQTNAHREGCAWADNPWVWVIEFRRTDRPEVLT